MLYLITVYKWFNNPFQCCCSSQVHWVCDWVNLKMRSTQKKNPPASPQLLPFSLLPFHLVHSGSPPPLTFTSPSIPAGLSLFKCLHFFLLSVSLNSLAISSSPSSSSVALLLSQTFLNVVTLVDKDSGAEPLTRIFSWTGALETYMQTKHYSSYIKAQL